MLFPNISCKMFQVKLLGGRSYDFGRKIREARRKCGLSQEQLADKMSVSRSAIAKWETDKGLPDVGNLKLLGQLLNTSLDRLLDDAEEADGSVIRERYNLIAYGPGCRKVKKDRVIRERFPDARIYTLLGRQELTELKRFADSVTDCRTTVDALMRDVSKSFYLIETGGRQLFVTLTDSFIETRPLEQPLESNSFSIDGWNFIKYNYEL